MTPASIAPGKARSVPKARPDNAQTTAKAMVSPLVNLAAPTNAVMASSMPNIQLRARP